MDDLIAAIAAADADPTVRVLVLTGGPRVFAAGADIKSMADASPIEMAASATFVRWNQIAACRKPIIAAVSGYALGGGCELAMLCDIIIASDTAQFGQPEVNIGVIPGAGGTARLTRALGPYRAMELILTGTFLSAHDALQYGLVNRICPAEAVVAEAQRLAAVIASKAPVAIQLAKEAIRAAAETSVRDALAIEQRNFYLLFATEDQKEGMRAFVEKRPPVFTGR
jgi:enoyl-CoA hydratase